jgi:hypothetical protein
MTGLIAPARGTEMRVPGHVHAVHPNPNCSSLICHPETSNSKPETRNLKLISET